MRPATLLIMGRTALPRGIVVKGNLLSWSGLAGLVLVRLRIRHSVLVLAQQGLKLLHPRFYLGETLLRRVRALKLPLCTCRRVVLQTPAPLLTVHPTRGAKGLFVLLHYLLGVRQCRPRKTLILSTPRLLRGTVAFCLSSKTCPFDGVSPWVRAFFLVLALTTTMLQR